MGDRPKLVGLLGGVASGKSAAAAIFRKLGAEILDADRLAHEALAEAEVQRAVRARFGAKVFAPDGSLDRKKLGAIVFASEPDRRALEDLIHPRVRRKIEEGIGRAKAPVLVLDVPLLAEAGLAERCDFRIFVETPAAERAARAKRTRGWDDKEVSLREISQGDLDEKKRLADFVVRNAGALEELETQVKDVFEKILKRIS